MKILYLSCHSILEYDELRIFEELGLDYFSLGSYIDPGRPVDPIRPSLRNKPDEWLIQNAPLREKLTPEFVEYFDTIIVMHVPQWITANWPLIKNKRVIWRTIGQSTPEVERKLAPYRAEGLQVLRYSPREQLIKDNIGFDGMIRFYKDPVEFNHWVGGGNEVITFAQDMKHRGEYTNPDVWLKVVEGFNAKVYGPKNDEMGEYNGGFMAYDQMKQKMRDARVYFYTGTQPASYTLNFIEALMTGVPIVALGPKYANSLQLAGDTYEIPDIIQNGVNGFWSDDIDELRGYIKSLVNKKSLANHISAGGRETAIKLFGKESVKMYWSKFLNQK